MEDSQLPEASHEKPIKPESENTVERNRNKIHNCDICDKNFKRKQHFVSHMRTHTKERPYDCKFCGKSFTQSASRNLLCMRKFILRTKNLHVIPVVNISYTNQV